MHAPGVAKVFDGETPQLDVISPVFSDGPPEPALVVLIPGAEDDGDTNNCVCGTRTSASMWLSHVTWSGRTRRVAMAAEGRAGKAEALELKVRTTK